MAVAVNVAVLMAVAVNVAVLMAVAVNVALLMAVAVLMDVAVAQTQTHALPSIYRLVKFLIPFLKPFTSLHLLRSLKS